MRFPSAVLTPLAMAALVVGLGAWLRAAGMAEARLSYDAMGGPAAYVLYAIVVGLGIIALAVDRVVRHVAIALHVRRVRRDAARLPPAHLARSRA